MGLLFALMSAVGYATMTIFVRKAMDKGGADNGVLIALLINVVLHGAVVSARAVAGVRIEWVVEGIVWFVASGVLTTLLGRVALYGGIRRIGSSRAAALKNLSPFVTVAAALIFLGERLTSLAGVGVAIALASYLLFMAEGYRRSRLVVPTAPDVAVARSSISPGSAEAAVGGPRGRLSWVFVGYLSCTAAAAFYGSGTVMRKLGVEALPDPFLGALVSAFSGLSVYVLYLAMRKQLGSAIRTLRAERQPYFWLAGLASTIGQLSLFLALSLTAVSYVSVISSSDTLLTLFLAAIFLGRREAINARVAIPAAGIFIGTVFIGLE